MFFDKLKSFIEINMTRLISTGVAIVIIFSLLLLLNIITRRFIKKAKHRRAITLIRLVRSIFRYLFYIVGFISILAIWGYNVSTILAGAGIMGLVIGLGSQHLIADLLSGISIVFENYYEIDDVVEINGFKGKVVEIGIRSTQILNSKGELKIIANGEIKEVINYSRHFSLADVTITISYQDDVNKVISLLEANLPNLKTMYAQILEGPNVVGVRDLNANGVALGITAKTLSEQQYEVERGIRKYVYDLFNTNQITIPVKQVMINDKR
jgi:small-conductance mechanosensitive channel